MANLVTVQRIWPTGDIINVQVKADSAYPDALDQARACAIRGFREALDVDRAYDTQYAEPIDVLDPEVGD